MRAVRAIQTVFRVGANSLMRNLDSARQLR
jgi:hypothetical protein